MSLDISLDGRVALVTGASRGIGRAIAVALAEAGADVALLARSKDLLEETAALVAAAGGRTHVAPCDVTDEGAVEAAVSSAEDALGPLDVVVNNAGGARYMASVLDTALRGWEKALALNLTGPFLVARAAARGMVGRRRGSIVNIASLAGLRGLDHLAQYSASKGGLLMLTKAMAREWGPHGVRVNTVAPGLVATEGWSSFEETGSEALRALDRSPLGRWAEPREIAMPVVFLASDAASYITGETLVVDGGASV